MNARDALRQLRTADVGEDPDGVRWYVLVDTQYEDVEAFLVSLTRGRPMAPKPITRALTLIRTLYAEQRPPTYQEFRTIQAALKDADARTRLDPSKRKRATVKR